MKEGREQLQRGLYSLLTLDGPHCGRPSSERERERERDGIGKQAARQAGSKDGMKKEEACMRKLMAVNSDRTKQSKVRAGRGTERMDRWMPSCSLITCFSGKLNKPFGFGRNVA